MSFYKGTQSDTFMVFRLKKRIGPKSGRRDKVSIVDESTSIFGYENRSQALKNLKEEMWRKLSLGLQGRSLRQIRDFSWLVWWVLCVTCVTSNNHLNLLNRLYAFEVIFGRRAKGRNGRIFWSTRVVISHIPYHIHSFTRHSDIHATTSSSPKRLTLITYW